MQKTIKTRIQHKHDIEYNWNLAENFVPLQGELIIYDIEVDNLGNALTKVVDGVSILLLPEGRTVPFTHERAKIGDGIHNVADLPFITDNIDLSDYVTESELEGKGYLTEHQSLAGYATESFVAAEIAKAKLEGEEVDLSGYATKDDIKDFIKEVPSEYITESELEAKKYLTQHQDISHLAEKSELFSGSYNDLSDKPNIPSVDGLASESYVNNSITTHNANTTAHNDIRILITELTTRLNTVANSSDVDLDQLSEIVAYIKNNKNLIDGITTNKINVSDIINDLTTNVANKPLSAAQGVALKGLIDTLQGEFDLHGHEISEVTGLQDVLDGKAPASHGTHVSYSSTDPVMAGTANAGSAATVARSDHRHPTDTSRAAQADLTAHTGNTTVHITSAERTDWNAAKAHADAAHAPSNAEKNQNAFSNITVGSTTIAADTATDTVTLIAGSNITITPDATNDKITIAATDTTYGTGNATTSGLTKLYTGTGSNTDGTMTQSAITNALNGKEAAGAAAAALESAQSYTDDAVAALISCGTADPSSSITSQFYFKYATD